MLSLLLNPSQSTAPDESAATDESAAPALPEPQPKSHTSVWRRIGAGTFGGGMLGLVGLLSGFLVPVATLCLRLAHGATQNYDATGGFPFTELFELLIALFMGLGQGLVGLLVGLVVGFALTALGKPETRPRRMVHAMLVVCVFALVSAVCIASSIVDMSPSA